mgnify:CR=1 FL=1
MEVALLKLTVNGYITTLTRRVMNYYFSVTDFVPSTQVRGAILAEYYKQKGKVDMDFFVSPAFPLESAPAHYFSPASGRKSGNFVEKRGILKEKEDELSKGRPLSEVLRLNKDDKPRVGAIIRRVEVDKDSTKYTKYTAESAISMNVAIDKTLASARHGMLFAYEYRRFGELWALARPSEVLDVVKGGEIRIGRGKNRGNTAVKVQVVREVELPEPEGLVYCLSQCVPSLLGKEFFKVKRDSEGVPIIVGETSTYAGWFTTDSVSGQKPSFRTLSEGTLIYIEEKRNYADLLPAGLNFALSINDLSSLLDRVRP